MLDALDLSTLEIVLCGIAAVFGAVIQGAIGFGYALVVVPALLLFGPEAAAVGASALRGARSTSPPMEVAAGFASGVAGTVGAVGGPYMGLAYADRPGPVLRATISLAFAVGVVLSLTAVGIAGEIEPGPLRLGVALVPFTFTGLFAGRRLVARIDGGRLRPAVLAFAGAAGAFALLRGLL